jgi:hypothetical protein
MPFGRGHEEPLDMFVAARPDQRATDVVSAARA